MTERLTKLMYMIVLEESNLDTENLKSLLWFLFVQRIVINCNLWNRSQYTSMSKLNLCFPLLRTVRLIFLMIKSAFLMAF